VLAALMQFESPTGAIWELLAAVLVIIIGPALFERLHLPGLIGLLVGGLVIGPHVLGIAGGPNSLVSELGQIGLLYLMFLAGLELDLTVFARHRNDAITFTALTFFIPATLGLGAGLLLGYGTASAILLGSLFASYTLVSYPAYRRAGLAANRAVAIAVGATVITDTMSLTVLAGVSGATSGKASGFEIAFRIAAGLAILLVYTFVVLPVLARWFFASLGQQRQLRYAFVLASLLSAGVVATVVGNEPIVGAFFAGLALNRLVPNQGEFMERIEFFGSSLLVPLFLVSVGTVIDPGVMFDLGTLGIAAIFVVACCGGKFTAALISRPLLNLTFDEMVAMFSLSVAQAAATLAATFVGLQLGLFTTTTVNAVMIVVIVSLTISSVTAARSTRTLPLPETDTSKLGRTVLVQLSDPERAAPLVSIARRIADADAGVIRPVVVVSDGAPHPTPALLAELTHSVTRFGIDAEIDVRHDRSEIDGLLHAATSKEASLVVVPAATESWLPTIVGASQHGLVAACEAPVALVRPGIHGPERLVLVLAPTQARRPTPAAHLAVDLARRLARSGMTLRIVAGAEPTAELLGPLGNPVVTITSTVDWLETSIGDHDLVLMPGGRNGAMATARNVRTASNQQATVMVVADNRSVTPLTRAVQSLGLVTNHNLVVAGE
jgi:Kef-type K+ transport system membrane component KefB